jgi:hypothetical protein
MGQDFLDCKSVNDRKIRKENQFIKQFEQKADSIKLGKRSFSNVSK